MGCVLRADFTGPIRTEIKIQILTRYLLGFLSGCGTREPFMQ